MTDLLHVTQQVLTSNCQNLAVYSRMSHLLLCVNVPNCNDLQCNADFIVVVETVVMQRWDAYISNGGVTVVVYNCRREGVLMTFQRVIKVHPPPTSPYSFPTYTCLIPAVCILKKKYVHENMT